MRDREMVAAIVAGDPAGLAAAYERYAAGLHAYCREMAADPADAGDAVRDTFIAAAGTLAVLREPDLLRPWLYAVARNACHRRRAAMTAGPAGVPGEPANGTAGRPDHGGRAAETGPATARGADQAGAEWPERRELVGAAMAALSAGERDVVELNLRHDLDEAGLAAVFGLSRGQARALAARARNRFEASLGALLVARAGPEFCPELAAVLAGWDGELTDPLRKRLGKHIGRCPVCGERRRRKLQPTMLAGLPPAAVLPDGVWRQVIRLTADATPVGVAKRAHITQRAEPFGKSGFPVPLGPPAQPRPAVPRPSRPLAAAVGTAAVAVLGAGIVAVAVTGAPHFGGPAQAGPGPVPGVQATDPTAAPQVQPGPAHHTRATPGGPVTGTAVPVRATTAPAPTGPVTLPPTIQPTMPPTVPPTSASATPPAPGTLAVSPATVILVHPGKGIPATGGFTLTANGGPVAAFVITVPAAYLGDLTVVPVTGALTAGQSVQVSVTLRKGYRKRLNTQLSVQPGGLAVTVLYRPAAA